MERIATIVLVFALVTREWAFAAVGKPAAGWGVIPSTAVLALVTHVREFATDGRSRFEPALAIVTPVWEFTAM